MAEEGIATILLRLPTGRPGYTSLPLLRPVLPAPAEVEAQVQEVAVAAREAVAAAQEADPREVTKQPFNE